MLKNHLKILENIYNKYKNESWILNEKDIQKKVSGWFQTNKKFRISIFYNDGYLGGNYFEKCTFRFGLECGIVFCVFPDKIEILLVGDSYYKNIYSVNNRTLREVTFEEDGVKNDVWGLRDIQYFIDNTVIIRGDSELKDMEMNTKFNKSMTNYWFNNDKIYLDNDPFGLKNEIGKTQFDINIDLKDYEYKLLTELFNDLKNFKEKTIDNKRVPLLKYFDKDSNGIVDVLDGGDDFMKIVKKHQKKIIKEDKKHIQEFVKLSNYLKTKRENIQKIFNSFNDVSEISELEEYSGLLKDQIHVYELFLLHSLSMVTSLVDDDLITFYEIYECFDKLNIFNSNWENEVSNKLQDIGDGIHNLIYSIEEMEKNIVSEISNLTYVTEKSFKKLNLSITRELETVQSLIRFNNLVSVIQTYQMYKVNKNTKSLRN
tara:strand:- start:55 stop:1341 length:1287 start_codon:yes stop_codon:yes gene_type:complete